MRIALTASDLGYLRNCCTAGSVLRVRCCISRGYYGVSEVDVFGVVVVKCLFAFVESRKCGWCVDMGIECEFPSRGRSAEIPFDGGVLALLGTAFYLKSIQCVVDSIDSPSHK